MYRLRKLIKKSSQNSFRCKKLQQPRKITMQQVQMALMEEPITQINQFSTQKLEHISHAFRLPKDEVSQVPLGKGLRFDGKLHLDLKIDQILLQIQQCKVNLAEILEMYLPTSSNKIEITDIQLSNLKPSFEEEQFKKQQTKDENEDKMQEKLIKESELNEKKPQQDEFMKLRRQRSYEINNLQELKKKIQQQQKQNKMTLEEIFQSKQHTKNLHQQLMKQLHQAQNQKTHHQQSQWPSQQISQTQSNIYQTLLQKKQSGKQTGEQLTRQINQQISEATQNLVQKQIKQNTNVDDIIQKIQRQLGIFKKTLMLRQAQLGMLIFITEMSHDQQFIAKYDDIYHPLKQYVIPLDKLNQQINVYVLEEVFQIESKFLAEYIKYIQQIKKRMDDHRKSQNQLTSSYSISSFTKQSSQKKLQKVLKSVFKLKIINSKIITMAEVFPYACVKDLKDLFSFSQSHQRWQKLIHDDIITYKIYGQPQKVRKAFESLKNNLNIINASMNILNQSKDLNVLEYKNWGKIFDSASKILKVALFKNDAFHEAALMISQPDGKLAKEIWNLPQNKTLQNFISAVLPTIQFSDKIYIPKVLKEYFDSKGKDELPNVFCINRITQYGNELFTKGPYQKKIPCRINAKHRINRRYQTKTKDQQEQQKRQKKPQSYSKMFFNTLSSMTKAVSGINSYFKKQKQNSTTAILHIHGGGFISMSSFIHQTYTRNWANNLQVPILSVDYGKAPQYPYPNGLYDCLEAYMWLRFVFRQVYNCEVQKVIIVGDSAGGNLAAALTTLLIQWNLPKPDGLVLVYPALNLNINDYTPSLLHALNDMILPHTFLKLCLRAYIKDKNFNPITDQLISPIKTKAQTLKKYPRTKIFVGGKDPFHDDCCRFVENLNEQKPGIADLTIFQQFPHGFLQFDMATNPHDQARKATKQVQKGLREVMEYQYKQKQKQRQRQKQQEQRQQQKK